MEDKEIIRGNFKKINTISFILWCFSAVSIIVSLILGKQMHSEDGFVETYLFPQAGEASAVFFWLFIISLIVGIYFYIEMKLCEIIVTNKRTYGKTKFGKLVDLPYDMISSVGTGFPKGVFVATSSGLIKFWMLSNQQDVYNTISKLLRDRQNENNNINNIKSEADELKKYKALLDCGAITQQEYESKKKELLNLN